MRAVHHMWLLAAWQEHCKEQHKPGEGLQKAQASQSTVKYKPAVQKGRCMPELPAPSVERRGWTPSCLLAPRYHSPGFRPLESWCTGLTC